MSNELKIGVVGAGGRMGRMNVTAIHDDPFCRLVAAADAPGSDCLGADAATLANLPAAGVVVTDDPEAVFEAAEIVIDFTLPAATSRQCSMPCTP